MCVVKRMWINQRYKDDPLHRLHGTNVLATPEREGIMRVYYLSGDVISSDIPERYLFNGWVKGTP